VTVDVGQLAQEHAALRRVATLVAQAVPSSELFDAVAREVGTLLGGDFAGLARFDDGFAIGLGAWAAEGEHPPVPPRWPIQAGDPAATIEHAPAPTRWNDWSDIPGPIAAYFREMGVRSSLGTPIVVEGRLWGALALHSKRSAPFPPGTETRMQEFTDLLGTAIANAQARADLSELAHEQAALRRVATLVAQGATPEQVFAAVTDEVAELLDCTASTILRYEGATTATVLASRVGPNVAGTRTELDPRLVGGAVRATGRAARFDTDDPTAPDMPDLVRAHGIRSAVASPIVVEGELWGVIAVGSFDRRLPAGIERRLTAFTELVATAVANTQARAQVRALADEQAALRRVATLVAREASADEVMTAIADECRRLFGTKNIGMVRYEGDRYVVVALTGEPAGAIAVGSGVPLDGDDVVTRVYRTGAPVRVDDIPAVSDRPISEYLHALGLRSAVATPIMVEGRLWGAIGMATVGAGSLPPDTEARLGQFTELMATAIANTESRARVDRLTEEQAALRRVATLVAKGASLPEVFTRVAEEASRALGDVDCGLWRDDGDGSATLVAVAGKGPAFRIIVGRRRALGGDSNIGQALRERRPSRAGGYPADSVAARAHSLGVRSSLACPVFVGERAWGAIQILSYDDEPIPAETETRIMRFGDLVATAIANTEARAEVERLAEEQAALRRVATLVAQGAPAGAVFDTVAAEIKRLLKADHVTVSRYEPGSRLLMLAHRAPEGQWVATGTRISLEGDSVHARVLRTRRPARMESHEGARGPIAEQSRSVGLRVSVGTPIVVDGRLWGVVSAGWSGEEPLPADTEQRMAQFGQLVDTAIANADSHDKLTASRARVLTAGDEARRRVARDLHDGAQQQLVHAIVTLKLAQRSLRENDGQAESLLGDALARAEDGNQELRELAHGILPSVLTHGGLRPAVRSLATRLDLPVRVQVPSERFPAEVEASAYFIVAEALTNVVKHAHAEGAEVSASIEDGTLRVEVHDDGRGGADPGGHGLVGMSDRVSTLGGRLEIDSAPGAGTRVTASLPLD
jgi:GAF domain-containing protein